MSGKSQTLPNSLLVLATIAVATEDNVQYPKVPCLSLTPPKKRRRSESELLANKHYRSERYAPVSLKYDGKHNSLVTQGLSLGDPYKRFKRAKKANSATRIFEINDDGDMFENTANKRRMVGEGKTVVGPKAYAKAKTAELERVKGLKGQWGAIGRGYKERWPDTWEAELEAKVSQKLVCITKVSAHLMRKNVSETRFSITIFPSVCKDNGPRYRSEHSYFCGHTSC